MPLRTGLAALVAGLIIKQAEGRVLPRGQEEAVTTTTCRSTQVAILGAGVAGITAAQALHNASVEDFLIIDRNDYVGGRVRHTTFGASPADGTPYTVELGANWVQGLGGGDGGATPENPIWTFTKKHGIANTYSNYSSILTYDWTGEADYLDLFDEYDVAYAAAEQEAGRLLLENQQDVSVAAGLGAAGWRPRPNGDMRRQAVAWWMWDFEAASPPEQSSLVFGVAGSNLSYNQWSDENNFVTEPRGFNTWLVEEAAEFLGAADERLLLSTTVRSIQHDQDGVTVTMEDGSCVQAAHAVCTFALGVLQNDAVEFQPALPRWKNDSIQAFQMGTYTKIFMQFNTTFWDPDTQFFLYADQTDRGRYPIFQSLSTPGFLEGSNILFVTAVAQEAYRIEQQSDEETQAEVMEVLRTMFPDIDVPEPTAFLYPRWSQEEWTYGSYSNWPVGVTLEKHQNLRANVDRLWFAGEATSAQYFGFLQGAWYEGRDVGQRIAGLVGSACTNAAADGSTEGACGEMLRYEQLPGTTEADEYNVANGWPQSSFVLNGEDDE